MNMIKNLKIKSKELGRIDKPWGWELLLEKNKYYVVKALYMKKGNKCSYQYHNKKIETIMNLSGHLMIVMENQNIMLKPGDFYTLLPKRKHRMYAKDTDCLYLESSTPQMKDVVRLEDDYGRC